MLSCRVIVCLSCLSVASCLRMAAKAADEQEQVNLKVPEHIFTHEEVQKLATRHPDWDEPFSRETLSLAKKFTKATAVDEQYISRDAMMHKLKAMNNSRVMVMGPQTFLAKKWVDRLPENGAVIFVHDNPYRSSCISPQADAQFLNNPKILAVASENWIGPDHEKVTKLPIGFESSLMAGKYGSALEHFLKLIKNPVPAKDRKYNVISDAQLHIFPRPNSGGGNDRGDMVKEVERAAIDDWYEKMIDFDSHLTNHVAQARLALCPEGNGLDCHRFYHNYAMRTRCIVRKGHLTSLHSQFPGTIVVDSWKEVTAANINKWMQQDYTYNPYLIHSSHWINKVLKKVDLAL